MRHRDGCLGLLGDMRETEGMGAEGVDRGMRIELAHALWRADEEGVGRQPFAGSSAFDMTLAKAMVWFLRESGLLGRDRDGLFGVLLLQRRPVLDTGAKPVGSSEW